MSADAGEYGLPPSYEADDGGGANEALPPTIYVLAGHNIHAESADAAPLYQTTRGIASLTQATKEVPFERVERSVRMNVAGEPAVKPRPRHLYNLKHADKLPTPPGFRPHDDAAWYIQAVSRRTAGAAAIGLKKSLLRSHWRALPVDITGHNGRCDLPQFLMDQKPLFVIHHRKGKYEWMDANGSAVAVEDEADGQHRLIVTAALPRETVDALVALWCCRLWQNSAERAGMVV